VSTYYVPFAELNVAYSLQISKMVKTPMELVVAVVFLYQCVTTYPSRLLAASAHVLMVLASFNLGDAAEYSAGQP
jgi:hypothetical protein